MALAAIDALVRVEATLLTQARGQFDTPRVDHMAQAQAALALQGQQQGDNLPLRVRKG